jgi:hypothetical protein
VSVPTRNQIAAQIEVVLDREPQARCIAIRSAAHGPWPEALPVRDRSFLLRWCESPLAIRESLVDADGGDEQGVVVLTPVSDAELGADVIARLERGRVFRVEGWETVHEIFHAREVDARLARRAWMATVLLENMPPGGYAPVPGGFLDLDTAWRHVLETSLGITEGRPDAVSLVRWSLGAEAAKRFGALTEPARSHVIEWLSECAGPVGALVVQCAASGRGPDALPLGLICGVVFAPDAEGQAELAAAAVRLERYVGNTRIDMQVGRRWAEAAAWVLRSLPDDSARPFLHRADGLLRDLQLERYAGLSDVLPSGFETRLAAFAEAIVRLLAKPSSEALTQAELTASRALGHDRGQVPNTRNERVRMALRLARWLVTGTQSPSGFQALTRAYVADGAFVDWARLKLLGGDELAALSTAYAALADSVRARREEFNRRFAEGLKAWNASGPGGADCLPVEGVLERIVAPVALKRPVLLLVVDGLAYPVFRELAADLARNGWAELMPDVGAAPAAGIAALPTVTEISRASLLSGQLTSGASGFEKSAFAAHPALLGASKGSGKPVVFHKGELGDATGLAQEVRDTVGGNQRQVVAVVYNAVDDNLGGSDQLHLRWSLDELRMLKPLLHEARLAGRVLIVTSDHGHVIDERTTLYAASDGDRWRTYAGPTKEGEILLEGGRVRAPTGDTRIVCAWSECLRFGGKKNGYHGGASPQEVVVPVNVFVPPMVELAGWKPAPPAQPEWWEERPAAPAPKPIAFPAAAKAKTQVPAATGDLFEGVEPVATAHWIEVLLENPTYQQQRQLAARVAPRDEDMRSLLEALESRGGKLSKGALAQKLGLPIVRISGLVNAARRVLNVDQSAVLILDEAAGVIELNRELLDVQFQLKAR